MGSAQCVVNCDVFPYIPSGLSLEGEGTEHRKMGQIILKKCADGRLYANGEEVIRCLPERRDLMSGHERRAELKDKRVLNACIADALILHPELIPDDWVGDVYFWGDVFSSQKSLVGKGGGLFVLRLHRWHGDGLWRRDYCWLDCGHHMDSLAALLKDLPVA
jgi:hypothetical protein